MESIILGLQKQFLGTWRLVETEMWDSDALDLLGPAHITFGTNQLGEIQLIAIQGSIDYRASERDSKPYVEFSWSGFDDNDQSSGRGWARLEGARLLGRFFIHQGDDSGFVAERGP
ncbi:MAG: hypothetical protein ACE5M4_12620 [Anaerolineales bacterium]